MFLLDAPPYEVLLSISPLSSSSVPKISTCDGTMLTLGNASIWGLLRPKHRPSCVSESWPLHYPSEPPSLCSSSLPLMLPLPKAHIFKKSLVSPYLFSLPPLKRNTGNSHTLYPVVAQSGIPILSSLRSSMAPYQWHSPGSVRGSPCTGVW